MNLHFPTRLTEIADLVRYRGTREIASATAVEVPQFKCSIACHDVEMLAFNIKKTLQKFAKTDFDFTTLVGINKVEAVVCYEPVTNRPFSPALIAAGEGRQSLAGDAADQANYIKEALSDVGTGFRGLKCIAPSLPADMRQLQ